MAEPRVIITKKNTLRKVLCDVLQQFEHNTGVAINTIDIEWVEHTSKSDGDTMARVVNIKFEAQ